MKTKVFLFITLFFGLASLQLASASQYNVEVDTSAVQGSKGAIVFEFTSSTPSSNTANILNFVHDGVTDLPETQGGLIIGDIILRINPAPWTEIESMFFFNELVVPFTSFGTSISFTVQLTENASGPGILPDEFSFFILGPSRLPLFATMDTLGADSLFSICADGSPTGLLNVFEPTTFTSPSLLKLIVPAGGSGPININITANDFNGPITLGSTDTLSVKIDTDVGTNAGLPVDWWVAANVSGTSAIDGWYYIDLSAFGFVPVGDSPFNILVTHQGPLFNLPTFGIILNFPVSGLPAGTYTFYFAVDMNMNGSLDFEQLFFDSVVVNINP
jgi:hypothetical protein